jgi:origin recognition complex subunit 6
MNRAAAERDLFSLLPSLSSGALPPELLELTTSFLAQSRASALKPDEEIARSYVCANIACERYVFASPQ